MKKLVVSLVLSLCLMSAIPQGGIEKKDGTYTVNVSVEGGSGRATVTSPAKMTIQDKKATVRIEWSSSNYDYMKLDSITYYPVNTDGNSIFELPVTAFDKKVEVIADTTAMSKPHEITYTILLDSATIKSTKSSNTIIIISLIAVGAIVIGIGVMVFKRRGKKNESV